MENGEDWNVAWPLKKMAGQFLNETFLLQIRKAGQGTGVLADKDELKAFLNDYYSITNSGLSSFLRKIVKRGTEEEQA